MNSVLTEYVLSKSGELAEHRSSEELRYARTILNSFGSGRLTYADAATEYLRFRTSTMPLDMLKDILNVPDNPIPRQTDSTAAAPIPQSKPPAIRWNPAEDLRLLAGILKFGTDNWPKVAEFVGNGRTRSQCYQRWTRGLDPRIDQGVWTSQQDDQLIMYVAIYGEKCWTKISTGMKNRSDVQCRYRFNILRKSDGFPDRWTVARQKVYENPAIVGPPLCPVKVTKTHKPFPPRKPVLAPGASQAQRQVHVEEEENEEYDEGFVNSEESGLDESESSDFDSDN
jgi:hypothetical protein